MRPTSHDQIRLATRAATRPAVSGRPVRTPGRIGAGLDATGARLLATSIGLASLVAWLVLLIAGQARAEPQSSAPIPPRPEVSAAPPAAARPLDALFSVPVRSGPPSAAATTDRAIAAAVARGDDGLRPKRSGFRKRNVDLFRTEYPVEIDGQEMLLRLRLRAKSRETMSVELRF